MKMLKSRDDIRLLWRRRVIIRTRRSVQSIRKTRFERFRSDRVEKLRRHVVREKKNLFYLSGKIREIRVGNRRSSLLNTSLTTNTDERNQRPRKCRRTVWKLFWKNKTVSHAKRLPSGRLYYIRICWFRRSRVPRFYFCLEKNRLPFFRRFISEQYYLFILVYFVAKFFLKRYLRFYYVTAEPYTKQLFVSFILYWYRKFVFVLDTGVPVYIIQYIYSRLR